MEKTEIFLFFAEIIFGSLRLGIESQTKKGNGNWDLGKKITSEMEFGQNCSGQWDLYHFPDS